MAKLGKYSWQAIQNRQIQERNLWLQAHQPETAPKEDAATPTITPPVNGIPDPSFTIPTRPPTAASTGAATPTALEYMATDNANFKTILGTEGTEPVYYSGSVRGGWLGTWDAVIANPFKNWARRAYANINNPYDILPAATPEQQAEIEKRTAEIKARAQGAKKLPVLTTIYEDYLGIDMDEVFKTQAVGEVAKEAGTNVGFHKFTKQVKSAAATAFFGYFGVLEWTVKNGAAVAKGLDDTADEVAGADRDAPQPLLNAFDKLQKAQSEKQEASYAANFLSSLIGNDPDVVKQNRDILQFAKVLQGISPVEIFKDAGRLVANLDKIKPGQIHANINTQLAGSQAVYSRLYDDAMNQEYIRRYKNGESPQKLAMEIQNPYVELAGGILLDPSTYFTGKSVEKLIVDEKTGARVIEAGIKSASLQAIDNQLLDVRMVKEVKSAVDDIVKAAEGATPKTSQDALDVIQTAFKVTKEAMADYVKRRGVTSLVSTDKQRKFIEDGRNVVRSLAARASDHPDGMDLFTGTLDAMIKMANGTGDARAFSALINNPLGQEVLSPRGMRTAHLMAGLDEVTPAMQKLIDAKDIKGVANLYADQIEKVTKRTILSVEEMRGASETIVNLTNKIGGNAVIDTARVAIKNATDAGEKLTSVKTVLTETKTVVKNMLDEFKGLVKVTSGKVKYLQDVRSSVLDNADKQIADLSTQLKALKGVAKDGQTQKAIAEIKGTLDEIRKLKKVSVVEDIGKAKGNYESAKETLRLLSERLDKDINKVVAAVERAMIEKNKAVGSLKDLAVDGRPVKSLIDDLDEAAEIAKRYDELPAYVKFFNGANEIGKKSWLRLMGFFSQLYFGYNRFAYPLRNVMSTNFAMMYEFGLSNALEISAKSIVGSQVEKIGLKALAGYETEIKNLIGAVPESFYRGQHAISDFVKSDKVFFGLVRGGGAVATMSERLMGAQIMLKTIQREMKNFVLHGGIPETKALESVGMHAEDAKKLLQYAAKYTGDPKKVVTAFRKYMGGGEDVFRHVPVPERLDGMLTDIGKGDASLKKELDALVETADSPDMFREGARLIKEKVAGAAEWSRSEPTKLSTEIPEEFVKDIAEAKMFQYASPEKLDDFERVLQGFHNAKDSMFEMAETLRNWFTTSGVDATKYTTRTIEAGKVGTAASTRQSAVRQLVNRIAKDDGMTSSQIWDELNKLDDFKLKNLSEVDPLKVSPRQLKSIMWNAYYDWSGRKWADVATDYNARWTDILESMAKDIGTDLPTAARQANVPYQKVIDDYKKAIELYRESRIDPIIAARRKVKTGITLADIDVGAIKQAGFKSQSHLFNSINAFRKANEIDKALTLNNIDFWEVEDAVRRLHGARGYIPELAEMRKAADVVTPAVEDVGKAAETVTGVTKKANLIPNRSEEMTADELLKFQEKYYAPTGPDYVDFYHGSGNVDEILKTKKLLSGGGGLDKIQGIDRGGSVFLSPDLSYAKNYAGYGASMGIKHADPGIVVVRVKRKTGTLNNIELVLSKSDLAKGDYEILGRLEDSTQKVGEVTETIGKALPADNLITGKYVPRKFPPIAGDQAVTPSRMVAEQLDDFGKEFDTYVEHVASKWGETSAPVGAMDDAAEKVLGTWVEELTRRTNMAKTEAGVIASATRDAMLFDYRKSLWNVAAQYVSPFHYYHASASKYWLQSTAADPKWAAIYIDYKEFMAQRHAGLPDFWKQNIAVSGLPGYDKDNPLFFNIEASINPLYQIMGADYNDPNRRKDWLSTTVDDLSKIVPGLYQPLQWVVAAELYSKGFDDAGDRWRGRMIPQTKIIKSVTNKLGIDIPLTKYNDLDPFVGILGDGLDPNEESRAIRYLALMPGLTEEQRIEIAHDRKGELWDKAVRESLSARALPEAASYFLGVGYKPRTTADIQTDQFYEDYRKLIAARSIMPVDEYKDSWDALRVQYPFMDALLIGRKAGEDRDTAFAYNVLGRIPPGEMTDIAKFIHVEPYMLESFYSNKGDLSKMLPQDRDRFMAAIVDLSAMLKMPDGATKQEWTAARNAYADMQTQLKKTYGDRILDQMNQYFDPSMSESDKKDYLATFPDVADALDAQTAYLTNTPILSAYYGGIDTVARYYSNQMYIQLEKEYGKDILVKVDYYYWLSDNGQTKEASAYKKQMGLTAYFARKDALQKQVNLAAINAAQFIPEGRDYAIRPDFLPKSEIQGGAYNYATTDQQQVTASQIWSELSEPMIQLIQEYFDSDKPLPYIVGKRLEYLGDQYNLSKQEVLRLLGLEQP